MVGVGGGGVGGWMGGCEPELNNPIFRTNNTGGGGGGRGT